LSALGTIAGMNKSGSSGGVGSGGGVNLGALQGVVGGGVTPAQMVGNNNQKLAQMLLQTPNGEAVA